MRSPRLKANYRLTASNWELVMSRIGCVKVNYEFYKRCKNELTKWFKLAKFLPSYADDPVWDPYFGFLGFCPNFIDVDNEQPTPEYVIRAEYVDGVLTRSWFECPIRSSAGEMSKD